MTPVSEVCSAIPYSSVSCFVESSYLTFSAIQLNGCHEILDLCAGNGETDYKKFYIFFFLSFFLFLFLFVCLGFTYMHVPLLVGIF